MAAKLDVLLWVVMLALYIFVFTVVATASMTDGVVHTTTIVFVFLLGLCLLFTLPPIVLW